MAKLRIEAITCAAAPLRTRERSSSKITSRTQWRRFSIVQWPRLKVSKRAGVAGRLLRPCTVSLRYFCETISATSRRMVKTCAAEGKSR
jgi:hypothetical protein